MKNKQIQHKREIDQTFLFSIHSIVQLSYFSRKRLAWNSYLLKIMGVFLLLSFIGNRTSLSAQDTLIVRTGEEEIISLENYLKTFVDSAQNTIIDSIIGPTVKFEDRKGEWPFQVNQSFKDDHWYKITIRNESKLSDYSALLFIGEPEICRLFYKDRNDIDSLITGSFINNDRQVFFNYSYLPIDVPKSTTRTFYFNVQTFLASIKTVDYAIYSFETVFMKEDSKLPGKSNFNLFHGVFFGVIVFVILFSATRLVFEKESAYIPYIFYLVLVFIYYITKRSPFLFTPLSSITEHILFYKFTFSFASFASYLWFIIVFLRIGKNNYNWFYRFSQVIIFAFLCLIALDFLSQNLITFEVLKDDILSIRKKMPLVGHVFVIILMYNLRKERVARFIIAGTFCMIAFAFLGDVLRDIYKDDAFVKGTAQFEAYYWLLVPSLSYTQIGVLLEVLFFSLGLNYRSKEQKEALENKVLKEQLKLASAEKDVITKQLEVSQMKQRASVSKYNALKARMNPHFTGNALNSIKALILNDDKNKAVGYLINLEHLMREILEVTNEKLIPLQRELDFCDSYLKLEQLRFSDRLNYSISTDDSIDTTYVKIPPLIFQPFLENSIIHGLLPKAGSCKLNISIIDDGDYIKCEIDDNGIGRAISQEKNRGKHPIRISHGIQITEERIALINEMYESDYSLSIIDKVDRVQRALGTKVIFLIPK